MAGGSLSAAVGSQPVRTPDAMHAASWMNRFLTEREQRLRLAHRWRDPGGSRTAERHRGAAIRSSGHLLAVPVLPSGQRARALARRLAQEHLFKADHLIEPRPVDRGSPPNQFPLRAM